MIELRDYQKRSRSQARTEYARGARAICYVAPTGAGKTIILGDTIDTHLKHHANARVNVYAHRRELLAQAAATFRKFGHEVGVFGEGKSAAVQVCSTQGVLARGEVDKCTMAVFDEAHHYAADLWGDVAKAHKEHGAIIVGATATPERGDGRPLDHMFDAIVVVAQVKELIGLGALVPTEVIRPKRRLKSDQLAQAPNVAYDRYAQGRRAVVFAPHVKAANEYADAFMGRARVVSGTMSADERDNNLDAFRAGRVPVLVNVNVLTEGWDDPGCDCVIIARSMGSVGQYIQAVGRAKRPLEGKRDSLVLDLLGVSYEMGHPDDERTFSLDGVGISRGKGVAAEERLCKRCQSVIEEGADTCSTCGLFVGLVTPESVGMELEAWKDQIRKDDDGKRVERLARWIGGLLATGKRGRSLFSAQYKYSAVYGTKPDAITWAEAMRRAGA